MDNLTSWYNRNLEDADFNRLGVMAFILLVQTCIIVPATLLAISLNGNDTVSFAIMGILSFGVLASLLGDLPCKVTIPLFIVSALVHLAIIVVNIF